MLQISKTLNGTTQELWMWKNSKCDNSQTQIVKKKTKQLSMWEKKTLTQNVTTQKIKKLQ